MILRPTTSRMPDGFHVDGTLPPVLLGLEEADYF